MMMSVVLAGGYGLHSHSLFPACTSAKCSTCQTS